MTVVTIKCAKCGCELDAVELDSGLLVYPVDPCPTCLSQAFHEGAADVDSDWYDTEDSSWDDDEEDEDDDWDEDDDDEDEEVNYN